VKKWNEIDVFELFFERNFQLIVNSNSFIIVSKHDSNISMNFGRFIKFIEENFDDQISSCCYNFLTKKHRAMISVLLNYFNNLKLEENIFGWRLIDIENNIVDMSNFITTFKSTYNEDFLKCFYEEKFIDMQINYTEKKYRL
jgi:hypothetical protein